MVKKSVIIFSIIIVLIVVSFVLIPKKTVYSKNPEDWIERQGNTYTVNVEKATEGKGYYNQNNEQYKFLSIDTAFSYDGIYQGEIFQGGYADENGNILIQITQDLIPNDGILQGIIVEKFENKVPIAYIFLDEDWKKQFGNNINIEWGKTYQNFKAFEFKPVSPGVYMNKIDDDVSRFNEDYSIKQGGIIVGNIKKSETSFYDINDSTVISLS